MKNFIIQFEKARSLGELLIYDGCYKRWLVTKNYSWAFWPGCCLIKNFRK